MIRVGSTFSGIGGSDLAAERAGMSVSWQCEINKDARSVLEHRFSGVPLHNDISDLSIEEGDVDVLVGGFPCQDLSIAGRREGLAGTRSGLFHQFARLLEEGRPKWFVLENVPGLFSSHNGEDFRTVLSTLDDIGYGLAWRVLNAQFFGVPQHRRRVVIVGHFGDMFGPAEVLFESPSVRRDSSSSRRPTSKVAALTATGVGTCGADDNQAQAGYLIPVNIPPIVSQAMSAKWSKGTSGPSGDEFHNLVTMAASSELSVRRLTPLECERLQGFPDGWTDVPVSNGNGRRVSDTARYKLLGNAMCVNVFEWVFARLAMSATSRLMTESEVAA